MKQSQVRRSRERERANNNNKMSETKSDNNNGGVKINVAYETIDGVEWEVVKEGEGSIRRMKDMSKEAFYNPIQEFNRDISIALVNLFSRRVREGKDAPGEDKEGTRGLVKAAHEQRRQRGGITIFEGLAATGLRSMRYAKEVTGLARIYANDIDKVAAESIRRNAVFNGLREGLLEATEGDASAVMYAHSRTTEQRFDVIDIDPFGSPAQFLDSAVQAVAEGGLLCVTFTDMAVLCGPHSDVCFTKYGSVPIRRGYGHEEALRIALYTIQQHASRYRRYVVPVLSFSIDYYIRVFARVYTSPGKVNAIANSFSYLLQCTTCPTHYFQPLAKIEKGAPFTAARFECPAACEHCGSRLAIGGPLWTAPIHDPAWVRALLDYVNGLPEGVYPNTRKRIVGVLSAVLDELQDVPLFVTMDDLCHTFRLSMPQKYVVENAFAQAKYRLSVSHTDPQALKTDAPMDFVYAVLRAWALEKGMKMPDPASPAGKLLANATKFSVDIKAAIEAKKPEKPKVPRFLPNPAENWGPGTKGGKKRSNTQQQQQQQQHKKKQKTEEKEDESK